MHAEKTRVLWLDRNAEQYAFSRRGARAQWVAAHLSTEVRTVLANTEAPMRSTRGDGRQDLVQRETHYGPLFRVEQVHGANQNFERIVRKRLVALGRQSQTDASAIRLGSLSYQVSTCLECLDGLRCRATGGRLKLRECRRGPGEPVGAGEEAERHPLGGAEFAVIAIGLHDPPYQKQELCRFAC